VFGCGMMAGHTHSVETHKKTPEIHRHENGAYVRNLKHLVPSVS